MKPHLAHLITFSPLYTLDETTDIELFMTIHTSKFLQMMGPPKEKEKIYT